VTVHQRPVYNNSNRHIGLLWACILHITQGLWSRHWRYHPSISELHWRQKLFNSRRNEAKTRWFSSVELMD